MTNELFGYTPQTQFQDAVFSKELKAQIGFVSQFGSFWECKLNGELFTAHKFRTRDEAATHLQVLYEENMEAFHKKHYPSFYDGS